MKKKFLFIALLMIILPICMSNLSMQSVAFADTNEDSTNEDLGYEVTKSIGINDEDENPIFEYTLSFLSRQDTSKLSQFDVNGDEYKYSLGEGSPLVMYSTNLSKSSQVKLIVHQTQALTSINSANINITFYKDWSISESPDGDLVYGFTDNNSETVPQIDFSIYNYMISATGTQEVYYSLDTSINGLGCGIYKFQFFFSYTSSNSQVYRTLDYYVYIIPDEIPDGIEDDTIPLSAYIAGTSSQKSFYAFEIVIDDERFNYIDRKALTWHVEGVSKSGIYYVYSEADLALLSQEDRENFNYHALYSSPEQNLLIFKYEPLYEGDWSVYATFQTTDAEGNIITVNTKRFNISTYKISNDYSVYIIFGVAGLIIIILLIIGTRLQIRREKVY